MKLDELKKTVNYRGTDYKISFNTNDFDVTYVFVNDCDVNVFTTKSNLRLSDLQELILKAIKEYITIAETENTITDFINWDGIL